MRFRMVGGDKIFRRHFFAQMGKMANEAVRRRQRLWRDKQGFTSLRVAQPLLKPQVFFTSSPNSGSLACEVVRFALL